MDRYDPPSLIPPIVASFLAAMCFSLARIERFPDEMRALFVFLGAIAAVSAAATGIDWLMYKGAIWLEDIRSAWNAPQLRTLELVAGMSPAQLSYAGMMSPFSVEARMAGGKVSWWLHTPLGDIPYGWVSDYLESCQLTYPNMIPQHGQPDSLRRDYTRWFTALMVSNELATQAVGSKAAVWNVPLADVAKRLGLE